MGRVELLGFEGNIGYLLIWWEVEELDEPGVETWDLKRLEKIFRGG